MSQQHIECTIEERISSKSNRPYKVLVVHLAPGVDKLVFLTSAEIALIDYTYGKE